MRPNRPRALRPVRCSSESGLRRLSLWGNRTPKKAASLSRTMRHENNVHLFEASSSSSSSSSSSRKDRKGPSSSFASSGSSRRSRRSRRRALEVLLVRENEPGGWDVRGASEIRPDAEVGYEQSDQHGPGVCVVDEREKKSKERGTFSPGEVYRVQRGFIEMGREFSHVYARYVFRLQRL